MHTRTTSIRVTKGSKENITRKDNKAKTKAPGKTAKVPRKALADKTNSASDDNASVNVRIKPNKNPVRIKESQVLIDDNVRPRRERRIPSRLTKDNILKNPHSSKEPVVVKQQVTNANPLNKVNKKDPQSNISPFKTPEKADFDSSLVANRPKRLHRLPSRFDDHSISPSNFVPVQPCFASTPIDKKKVVKKDPKIISETKENKLAQGTKNKEVQQENVSGGTITKESSDKNNNPKQGKRLRSKHLLETVKPQVIPTVKSGNGKAKSPMKQSTTLAAKDTGRLFNANYSYRLLEERKQSPKRPEEILAVYDFTFDPSEEPPPQKKKRKRVVRKKAAPKQKAVFIHNNYDSNVSKALESLKSVVNKNNTNIAGQKINADKNVLQAQNSCKPISASLESKLANNATIITPGPSTSVSHNRSVHVEHLVDSYVPPLDHDDIDYSPPASPQNRPQHHAKPSVMNETRDQLRFTTARSTLHPENHKDPLNLLSDLSFFDEEPVASSSMIKSVRGPLASPWRVELPVKRQVEAYIKPNMTPAVDQSYTDQHDSNKKRHVYTNLVGDTNESMPQIVTEDYDSNKWKQPSIISFIKEMAEKSLKKKQRESTTSSKSKAKNDLQNVEKETDKALSNSGDANTSMLLFQNEAADNECDSIKNSDQQNFMQNQSPLKRKNDGTPCKTVTHSPSKENNTNKYFGFDDSENLENVSPQKNDARHIKSLRHKRGVLQENNEQRGPFRAKLTARNKFAPTSEEVNHLFDKMKTTAVVAPEVMQTVEKELEPTNGVDKDERILENTDDASVHLFEDIDVVPAMKPPRKSYSKHKRVAFQPSLLEPQNTVDQASEYSSEEDDLSFRLQKAVKVKKVAQKKKKVQKQSKKEEAAIEAWAAAFNSMCEEVDEFPLALE